MLNSLRFTLRSISHLSPSLTFILMHIGGTAKGAVTQHFQNTIEIYLANVTCHTKMVLLHLTKYASVRNAKNCLKVSYSYIEQGKPKDRSYKTVQKKVNTVINMNTTCIGEPSFSEYTMVISGKITNIV